MKVGKPISKRKSVRLRHKIEKASNSKQRKLRKEAKKDPQWKSRLKKDPGIPNLFPYKAKILAEIEESKRRKQEEQMRKREIAKAQREGKAVEPTARPIVDEDELLDDADDGSDVELDEDTEMDVDSNPMAALLASAQARAQTFGKDDGGGDLEEEESDEEDQWDGLADTKPQIQQTKTRLPQQALDDPVKAVQLLMTRLEETNTSTQTILDHYQILPLVTAGSDLATRFLVEVARKRGRLGRGGIPNMHAAALIVLTDLHEERLHLPTSITKVPTKSLDKSEVKIVQTMAAPFKLEGLWGDDTNTSSA